MRSAEELRAFVRDELRPHVERWNRLPRWTPPGLLDAIVLVLVAGICLAAWRPEPLWGLAVFAGIRIARDVARVRAAFKRDVLRRVFEFVLPGVEYDPGARVAPKHVERSGLFHESWNEETGEDFVSGRLGATDFFFSELRLAREKKDKTHVVFRGLFFVADFHKSFRGRTYLLPDVAERVFGSLGRAVQALPRLDGTELIELEDPEFEKTFVCYATDPIEARYLLSPALMQRIVQLGRRAAGPLRASFLDESLYLAIPLSGDLFRVPFVRGSVDETEVLAWGGELLSVAGIVEELDLNTRIWSKAPAEAGSRGRG